MTFYELRKAWERKTLEAARAKCGSVRSAAKSLGMTRQYFYRLGKRLGLQFGEPTRARVA